MLDGFFELKLIRNTFLEVINLLSIAITISSRRISMEPREIKYKDVRTSPLCTKVSPGGACVVLNFNDKALKLK